MYGPSCIQVCGCANSNKQSIIIIEFGCGFTRAYLRHPAEKSTCAIIINLKVWRINISWMLQTCKCSMGFKGKCKFIDKLCLFNFGEKIKKSTTPFVHLDRQYRVKIEA